MVFRAELDLKQRLCSQSFSPSYHTPLHPQTGQRYLSWERVPGCACCPHLTGKAFCRLNSVVRWIVPWNSGVFNCSWGQRCVCSVARVNETHGPTHMQEEIVLGCRSQRRKLIMLQVSLEWKFCSFPFYCCFSCLCAFLLVLCARVYLNWFCILVLWHSIAFGIYKGVSNQAHRVSTAKLTEYPLQPQLKWGPGCALGVSHWHFQSHTALCCLHPVLLVLFCPCGCVAWIPFG